VLKRELPVSFYFRIFTFFFYKMTTKIIDLSHPIAAGMPVYPGTPAPVVKTLAQIASDGYREDSLALSSHTGTHIDAPAHVFLDGASLDQYPPETFLGTAFCMALLPEESLQLEVLRWLLEAEKAPDFILFYTAWEQCWGTPAYFDQYPMLHRQSAELIGSLSPRAIGIDAPSFDRVSDTAYPLHRFFLAKNILLIENMCGLKPLAGQFFTLLCAPLPLAEADGAPARIFAVLDHENIERP